jgi:hypothetical protein
MNLRTHSYLRSLENECVETLLFQMQIEDKTPEALQPPPPAVAKDEKKDPAKEPLLTKPAESTTDSVDLSNLNFFQRTCVRSKVCQSFAAFRKRIWTYLKPIESQSNFYLAWLGVVAVAYVYSVISISLRYSFKYDAHDPASPLIGLNRECVEQQEQFFDDSFNNSQSNWTAMNNSDFNSTNWTIHVSDYNLTNLTNVNSTLSYFSSNQTDTGVKRNCEWRFRVSALFLWMVADYTSDVIYLVDIFLVQTRIKFLKEGLWQSDIQLTAVNYFKSWKFIVSFFNIRFISLNLLIGICMPFSVQYWL